MLKESLDNALDYIESTPQQQQLAIHVTVQRKQGNYIIAVSNSNFDNTKAAFSKQTLESIFDFDRYHSSKRNHSKITKGALGDALKEVLCIPHVLARDYGIVTLSDFYASGLVLAAQVPDAYRIGIDQMLIGPGT